MKKILITFLLVFSTTWIYSQELDFIGEPAETLLEKVSDVLGQGNYWSLGFGPLFYQGSAIQLGNIFNMAFTGMLGEEGVELPVYGTGRETLEMAFMGPLPDPVQPAFFVFGEMETAEGSALIQYRLVDISRQTVMTSHSFSLEMDLIGEYMEVLQDVEIIINQDPGEPDSQGNPRLLMDYLDIELAIDNGNDEDYFYYENTTGEDRVIEVFTSGDLDLRMDVLFVNHDWFTDDPDDLEYITGNDDGPYDTNPYVEVLLPEGQVMLVVVYPYSSSYTGPYSIHMEELDVPEMIGEPNNSPEEALTIALGDFLEQNFFPTDDEDWFRLDFSGVSEGHYLAVSTLGDVDTVIEAYDEEGGFIAQNDDFGDSVTSKLLLLPSESEIFLLIREYSGGTGDYSINVEEVFLELDSYEPNDNMDSASEIIPGNPIQANLLPGSDVDFYQFNIETEGMIELETFSTADTYLTLMDAEGSILAQDDDSGEEYNALISMTVDQGLYFVSVSLVYPSEDDNYELVIR